MSGRGSRERKVRGSQIRASRDDKQRQKREQELTRLERERGPTSSTNGQSHSSPTQLNDTFTPDDQPFVETDLVRDVKGRIGRWLSVGRPVHLVGPTGCGKTALAMEIARQRDRPVIWINGDADLETSDLVGEFAEEERISERDKYIHNVVKSKDIVRDRWVDNPLTIAVREGATLVYNEFSRTKPVANNVLLSVFEEGVLELPGQRGESRYVDVHPEFRAILTSNSVEYAGVHEPQDALLDRLIGIHMDFYDFETEVEIVDTHVGDTLSRDRIEEVVGVMRQLRDELDLNVGTRAEIMAVEGLVTSDDPDLDVFVDICVDVLASKVAQHGDVIELRNQIESIIDDRQVSFESPNERSTA